MSASTPTLEALRQIALHEEVSTEGATEALPNENKPVADAMAEPVTIGQ